MAITVSASSCRFSTNEVNHEAYFARHINFIYSQPESFITSHALPYIDSVYRSCANPSVADKAHVYDFKSDFYLYHAHKPETAALYADSMLLVLKPYHGNARYAASYATAYMRKGNALYNQKYYASAYEWYFLGKNVLDTTDKASYNKYMSQFCSSLALACYEQGKYKQAIKLYHECLNRLASLTDYESFQLRQGTLDNIGLCYRNLNRPNDALKYFGKAIAELKRGSTQFSGKQDFISMALGLVYGNQGDAYLQQGNYLAARKGYEGSIKINSKPNYLSGDARLSKLKLASLCLKTDNFEQAQQLLSEVKPVLDTSYRQEVMLWLKTNAAYNHIAPNGNAQLAYSYLNQYVALNDAAQAEMRTLASANFNNQFDILKQQYELNTEEKRNHFNNIIVYSMCLVGMLLITITGSYLVKKTLTRQNVAPLNKAGQDMVSPY